MRRILFVDDEPRILEGLRGALRKHRNRWELLFANGAAEAMELMRAGPVDVLMSDMRMPVTDGAALLRDVQQAWPATVRIVLSGHTEMEATLRAVPVAHRFLSKPCDLATLEETLEWIVSILDTVTDVEIREALGRLGAVPSPPELSTELAAELDVEATSSLGVVAVLERDPAAAAKVLQVVNSGFFGGRRSLVRLDQAVSYLGNDMIRRVAVMTRPDTAPASGQIGLPSHITSHSIALARAAREVATGWADPDEAFLAGLMHDVGILVLAACLPERYARLETELRRNPRPLHVAEEELWGVTHAELAGYLLGLWNLPRNVVEAVGTHHRVAAMPGLVTLANAVRIAEVLVNELAPELQPMGLVAAPRLESLPYPPALIAGWRDAVEAILRETRTQQRVA